ncbi:GGDEF domain-containing protein [Tepidiforma bonchosmolovskayae]|uniref:GGDEF domain-containing protein n=2 Tax=Tepidiforma bonchosmolovskayae TaxID=2601677 RepID=A0ABX6C2D5_9CHLR|nr:GGDEF domain-containing protein [Tepidiforma bonchosmolovskayae]
MMALQGTIAAFFVAGELLGWFGDHSAASRAAVAWIAAYHIFRVVYVVRRRASHRPVRAIEALIPLLDVSCISSGWILLGNPLSPFWAAYLYALVGYARRMHGWEFARTAVFILANLAVAQGVTAWRAGGAPVNPDQATMLVIAATMASLAHKVGAGWREAERQARVLAETDPLTGLPNRRHFLSQLELRADAELGYAVLMMDIDDFKRLNDEHGHLHGDAVLARVARVLRANIREGDLLARYGGEEFVVAMPGADLAQALQVAERLRAAVERDTPSSISVGCAVRAPGETLDDVLRRADDLLLFAKRTGKNVVRWEPTRRSA